jgi:hypothetical protein
LEAQIEQSKYTSSNDVTFKIGNNKVLGTWHFRIPRQSKELDYPLTRLFIVSKII